MNKIVNIGLTALFACFVAACENDIDNYDAPNGGVYGTIYDKETNEPVPNCLLLLKNAGGVRTVPIDYFINGRK